VCVKKKVLRENFQKMPKIRFHALLLFSRRKKKHWNELGSFFVFVSWAKCGAPADAGGIYEGRLRAADRKEAAVKYLFIFFLLKKLRSVACPHAVGANKGSGAKFL